MIEAFPSEGQYKQDAFSPKRILIRIRQVNRYLLSKWKWILGSGLILALLAVLLSYPIKPLYTATFSFALDEGAVKSSTDNLSQLSQELGFGPSYEAGGVFSNMTNILELIQSRLLLEKTLKRSVVLYGRPVLFGNFFLDSLRYRNKWMKGSKYYNLDFISDTLDRDAEIYRNGIINNICSVINSKLLKVDHLGKGTTLIEVTLTSENELFSKYFLEALIDEVSMFYVAMKTYRSKLHVDFIQKRTDSVRTAYMSTLYGRANFTDANLNPNLQVNIVPGEKKQTDVMILRETYINLVKNLESSKTALMQETPLFQYLDKPILPLKVSAGSLLTKFILFFILGAFLTSTIILVRRLYQFIMEEPE